MGLPLTEAGTELIAYAVCNSLALPIGVRQVLSDNGMHEELRKAFERSC